MRMVEKAVVRRCGGQVRMGWAGGDVIDGRRGAALGRAHNSVMMGDADRKKCIGPDSR